MTGVDHAVSSNIDFTKTQLGVLLVTMLLAIDTINPVKIVLHVFPAIAPWHIATICILLSIYIWISEFKALLYFSVKIFFQSILSIFFRDVEIIGRDNIPRHGPIIFTVNHANQFMDAVTVVCSSPHNVSYLMAEASWKRRIIGDLAWALDVVPVKRPQDDAISGIGCIYFAKSTTKEMEESEEDVQEDPSSPGVNDNEEVDSKTTTATKSNDASYLRVHGINTKFTQQLAIGDKIRPKGTSTAVKVVDVLDDTTLILDATAIPPEERSDAISQDATEAKTTASSPRPFLCTCPPGLKFDVLKRIDQKIVYEKVLEKLASGGCIGIFPEGGSHDRTDLLPLKVGVALIAYSAMEKYGLNVPIVPVGLNYFHAHRWRGRAVVEYGEPIYCNPSHLHAFKAGGADRRQVCNELLDDIQDSMKSVIVSTPDYETLQLCHTARRLYQRRGYQGKEKQDLSRRFAEGYKQLVLMVQGDPPEAWLDLQSRILAYQRELRDLGIRDYQVPGLDRRKPSDIHLQDIDGDFVLREIRLPYQIVHLLVLLALAAIPTLFLNLPVGILAGLYSERRRKRALARSKVKIRAYDVMLTEKVVFCIVALPTLWLMYGLILRYCTDFDGPTIAVAFFSIPSFAYIGIIVSEAGMVELKDMRPYFMRLFPSVRHRLAALPATRQELQRDLRYFIKKLGPALGEIYYGHELNWKEIQEKSRKISMQRLTTVTSSPGMCSVESTPKLEDSKKDK